MKTMISSLAPALPRGFICVALACTVVGCETDTAQLVKDIEAAREGCTDEMLEAGAEECVQMFERYIEMGSGAIETYIGAMRAFDQAVDRGPTVRFDTAGLGHAISPDLQRGDSPQRELPLWNPGGAADGEPLYTHPDSISSEVSQRSLHPDYITAGAPLVGAEPAPEMITESRRDPAPQQQSPRRGAILPPTERLNRPWIGDEEPQPSYNPTEVPRRDALKPHPSAPKVGTGTAEPPERPRL